MFEFDAWRVAYRRSEQADAARDIIRNRPANDVLGGEPMRKHLLRKARKVSLECQLVLFEVDAGRAWDRFFGPPAVT